MLGSIASLSQAEVGIAGRAVLYASLRISLFALLLNIILASPVISFPARHFSAFSFRGRSDPASPQPVGWSNDSVSFHSMLIACTPPLNNHSIFICRAKVRSGKQPVND
ncbi:hypothetical protein [Mesorhizobium sp. RMAD-H1]|uniref:hypothetical protein n=1 Tax=Mesorhizobium sp. RMAD-H1 TaxID=2587065 RepID=UPI001619C6AB|nr:hypothetical protein [Mesorhizobium sp. RMAD-H1]MBB2971980.1 hypothetical protein [Mesorhizobium sp. RMAD-H1]